MWLAAMLQADCFEALEKLPQAVELAAQRRTAQDLLAGLRQSWAKLQQQTTEAATAFPKQAPATVSSAALFVADKERQQQEAQTRAQLQAAQAVQQAPPPQQQEQQLSSQLSSQLEGLSLPPATAAVEKLRRAADLLGEQRSAAQLPEPVRCALAGAAGAAKQLGLFGLAEAEVVTQQDDWALNLQGEEGQQGELHPFWMQA